MLPKANTLAREVTQEQTFELARTPHIRAVPVSVGVKSSGNSWLS
jgi:hypothetical protein